ncbi:heterodisulfide reductase subunit B [Candidatus Desantisbacteria bacterium CG2_30_40_21]|uniref:Heterodisulfide reductase subunit B n=5 Tax=unclassified Candidatus Desantisiibacteriota TaxID=3106372 RepID=A0A2M7JC00_9BACT|nr:MAG: heterodisulfide reductase subunit B [Candidatus Desantisbacteria bacterium CG2_30_40_21]PIP41622.1 MAG: heterodisulfide reductase subunit B [Candidatus Desantisbacteria bacterium CG23_combo_of_CG06-09_8_20_14_all_40_23]PIX16955.1 MAG: heterodisulfide reductase subunit B [Candidatus Desantisbacteria bacterium CG_4_8_14_3_um_filter_40_12]PIY18615.1 MAG: heterodisulfide reductase subunit B [Candidatus Desantisbacteria bacterium CG_4_10_14_3_um_filter_40_18]PJB29681.1 MAG: heterodisulfide r
MKFSYYPGCSLHSTGKEYGESTQAVCQALGIELVEIPDWNCCGASAGHSLNHDLAVQLSGRNLLLAQKQGLDIAVPCSACYHNLRQADEELKASTDKRRELEQVTEMQFTGRVQTRHLLDVIYHEVGVDNIRKLVKKPLQGLKAVAYYGCLITRPSHKDGFDSVEQPQSMDNLLDACGCKVMKWSYKTDCCGAGLSLPQDKIVVELVTKLINMARQSGAECIITACPMCQANLEMRQDGANFPVLYFTEVLGMALGMKDTQGWLNKHLVSTNELVGKMKIG